MKVNDLFKLVVAAVAAVAAVAGMACGGAFCLLGEAEFVVADATAVFCDPRGRGGDPDGVDGGGGADVRRGGRTRSGWCPG